MILHDFPLRFTREVVEVYEHRVLWWRVSDGIMAVVILVWGSIWKQCRVKRSIMETGFHYKVEVVLIMHLIRVPRVIQHRLIFQKNVRNG